MPQQPQYKSEQQGQQQQRQQGQERDRQRSLIQLRALQADLNATIEFLEKDEKAVQEGSILDTRSLGETSGIVIFDDGITVVGHRGVTQQQGQIMRIIAGLPGKKCTHCDGTGREP
jgi:hypothetical protein